ncbi:MAG: 1,4-alpha-glucan branching protein domain-containing protein [Gemmatimonadota bacterium]
MDVVLVLHSHIPYVLHHGRWPHGSDWLCEAAIDSYLPLLDALRQLADEDIPAPLTIGFTPVLANQLVDPAFPPLLREYFAQRDAACVEATRELGASADRALLPVVAFWRKRYADLRLLFERIAGNIPAAFAALEHAGRIEIIGSAATHGLLPLLARPESVALQLLEGRAEHRRIFGRQPAGCWLPECAYRPGLEDSIANAGFQYFFSDAHLARAGQKADVYGDLETGRGIDAPFEPVPAERSPYHPYRVGRATAFLRDPVTSRQVWSRYEGYPGDEHYLEFHKMRWPGGLRLWQVSAPGTGLGEKRPYRPEAARTRAAHHARHFVSVLADTARGSTAEDTVMVAPFDTELFGHWWFEGPVFLRNMFELLARSRRVRASTVSGSVHPNPPEDLALSSGTWGANGDFSMWQNPQTAWTWQRLWSLEDSFWRVAGDALANPPHHHVLAQAARELLLAQSSDWQFIITTGAAADYAEARFVGHCLAAQRLITALGQPGHLDSANQLATELRALDNVFPDILTTLSLVLSNREWTIGTT